MITQLIKTLSVAAFITVCSINAKAQGDFKFEKVEHDFGTIKPGNDTLWYSFKYTNSGSEPLVISDINTACDCTLADWSKKPVLPGKTGIVKGGFKIKGKSGVFNKTLTIFANTIPATTIITIKGVIK